MEVKVIKGTKQIGGCVTEIKCNDTRIIIDFGADLEENSSFELEGLTYGKSTFNAVFITHSHGDHIDLINRINKDIPIFVEEKTLEIHNLTCDFCNKEKVTRNINVFKMPELKKRCLDNHIVFQNNDLKVSAFIGDHSSFNSVMYLIEGDNKKVLHTGDFRNHGRRKKSFEISLRKIGKVDLLITEGTTLTRTKERFITEEELEEKAKDIMKNYDQAFIMQSSTNLDRTVSFLKASLRTNKKFILDLFSYYLTKECISPINVDNKNVFVWKPLKYRRKPKWFKDKYMNIKSSSRMFPNYAMEVKTSSIDDIKLLYNKGLIKNACLIYSMWDGYIEKEEKIKDFINECEKLGIDYYFLHTSGHADLNCMNMVNNKVDPNMTFIIHTEDTENGKKIFNNVIDIEDNVYYNI